MKRSIYFMGLLLLAGAMVFTACKKDDDDPSPAPSDKTPVLTFIGGAGYVTQDTEMAVNSEFMVGINAAENPTTQKNIESFKVVRTFNNVPTTVFDTNLSATDIMWEETMFAIDTVGEERWTLTVTDKDGEKKELSFVITTTSDEVAVVAYLNKTMGSWNDPTYGSFFATTTGTVLTKADATVDQASVDFAFYLGATNGSTFGAPSNAEIKTVFDLATAGWNVFNNTLFLLAPIDAATFDAIGDTYAFHEFTGTDDDINQLENGDVIFFKTIHDKLGLIKINSINGKGDVINIDVKVMQ